MMGGVIRVPWATTVACAETFLVDVGRHIEAAA